MGALKFLNRHKGKIALALGIAVAAYAYKSYTRSTPKPIMEFDDISSDLTYMDAVIQNDDELRNFYDQCSRRSRNSVRHHNETAVLKDIVAQYEQCNYVPLDVPVGHQNTFNRGTKKTLVTVIEPEN